MTISERFFVVSILRTALIFSSVLFFFLVGVSEGIPTARLSENRHFTLTFCDSTDSHSSFSYEMSGKFDFISGMVCVLAKTSVKTRFVWIFDNYPELSSFVRKFGHIFLCFVMNSIKFSSSSKKKQQTTT